MDNPSYLDIASDLGFIVEKNDHFDIESTGYIIALSPTSPIRINTVYNHFTEDYSLWIYTRTTSWDFSGDRSDLNDLLSSLFVIVLRSSNGISSEMFSNFHPVLDEPAGYFDRVITFERSNLNNFDNTENDQKNIKSVLVSFFTTAVLLSDIFGFNGSLSHQIDREVIDGEEWAKSISKFLNMRWNRKFTNYQARINPVWKWFRCAKSGINIFSLDQDSVLTIKKIIENKNQSSIDGPTKRIITLNGTACAISFDRIKTGESLLHFLEPRNSNYLIVPMEDRFYLLGDSHIAEITDNCGGRSYSHERQLILERQRKENVHLAMDENYCWSERIDGGRFESLIRELIQIEPGVIRVRQVSSSYEPDGGRDLEAEWSVNSKKMSSVDAPPFQILKILIQCKANQKSVGKGHVRDIRDTLDKYNADGYFLAVSSNLSTPLFDYLSELRARETIWIDWWTRSEIEDRLRLYPDILERYSDVITRK